MSVHATPLRELGTKSADATVILRDIGLGYRDGGEEEVLRIISEAKDLSSTSDELISLADGWAQTYHLHPSRANVLRGLNLPAEARVLEIGAGCGAITRYLGETCALVDALEPVPVRAAAARARTRDLANVEVFVGELDDVPLEPVYDVIVVIGVLEYVGHGTGDRAPYLDFLRGIEQRLAPGGSLVLAIENQLGVKYLAGAPEDHTNRLFDSLEDYPADSPARTFSRKQLDALFRAADLEPVFHVAFPDYKITRAVLGAFPEQVRSLLHRIPQFPSPDWMGHRPRLADEQSMWRTLVNAGLEFDTGNSFLVVASKADAAQLWPADVAGVFFSVGRRAAYTAETVVEIVDDTVRFRRRALCPTGRGSADVYSLVESVHGYEDGEDLLDHIARTKDADLDRYIAGWLEQLDAAIADRGAASIDLVPHNIVIDENRQLHVVDVELEHGVPREQVVRRGVYWMAYRVGRISAFDRWPQAQTVRDLAVRFGAAAGLDPEGAWLDDVINEEARVQTEIHFPPRPGESAEALVARNRDALRGGLDQRLADMPLGLRPAGDVLRDNEQLVAERDAVQARAEQLTADLAATRESLSAELDAARAESARLEHERAVLESSRAMRLTRKYRRGLDRVLPEGTRRRAAYSRLSTGRG